MTCPVYLLGPDGKCIWQAAKEIFMVARIADRGMTGDREHRYLTQPADLYMRRGCCL